MKESPLSQDTWNRGMLKSPVTQTQNRQEVVGKLGQLTSTKQTQQIVPTGSRFFRHERWLAPPSKHTTVWAAGPVQPQIHAVGQRAPASSPVSSPLIFQDICLLPLGWGWEWGCFLVFAKVLRAEVKKNTGIRRVLAIRESLRYAWVVRVLT